MKNKLSKKTSSLQDTKSALAKSANVSPNQSLNPSPLNSAEYHSEYGTLSFGGKRNIDRILSPSINLPVFEFKEIFKHATETSCWIVLDEKIYDVTEFIATHPGGQDVILALAGTDASSKFSKSHKDWEANLYLLEKYCIGKIPDNLEYQFDHCIDEKKAIHEVFHEFLTYTHSNEQLECLREITKYQEKPTTEQVRIIVDNYITPCSMKEVNIDHNLREEVLRDAKLLDDLSPRKFSVVEKTLRFQLRQDMYDLFLMSEEFRDFVTQVKVQTELVNSMDDFLNAFGKESQKTNQEKEIELIASMDSILDSFGKETPLEENKLSNSKWKPFGFLSKLATKKK